MENFWLRCLLSVGFLSVAAGQNVNFITPIHITIPIANCAPSPAVQSILSQVSLSLLGFDLNAACLLGGGASAICSLTTPSLQCSNECGLPHNRKKRLPFGIGDGTTTDIIISIISNQRPIGQFIGQLLESFLLASPNSFCVLYPSFECLIGRRPTTKICAVYMNISNSNAGNQISYGVLGNYTALPAGNSEFPIPDSPRQVQVDLRLFDGDDQPSCLINDDGSLNAAFNKNSDTKFIIHGYVCHIIDLNTGRMDVNSDFYKLATAMRSANPSNNIITVDWQYGAGVQPQSIYSQAASNTQITGAAVGQTIAAYGIDSTSCHCIGHSLGGQTCGFVGKFLQKLGLQLGRISGLDPAGPESVLYNGILQIGFQLLSPAHHLNSTDAIYVEAMHTNAFPNTQLSFGMSTLMGHSDVYVNGGQLQPQCNYYVDSGCSHLAALVFFISSVNQASCYQHVQQCNSVSDAHQGTCPCPEASGVFMGYYSTKPTASPPNIYYLATDPNSLCSLSKC